LGVTSSGADEVAEPTQRDPALRTALREQDVTRYLVGLRADRVPVAEPDDAALSLEIAGELIISVELRRAHAAVRDCTLDRVGLPSSGADVRDGARNVELGATALEGKKRQNVRGPRRRRRGDPWIERVGGGEPGPQLLLEGGEPCEGEDPLAGT